MIHFNFMGNNHSLYTSATYLASRNNSLLLSWAKITLSTSAANHASCKDSLSFSRATITLSTASAAYLALRNDSLLFP